MHSDPEAMKKSVRTYLKVGAALYAFTILTVAVNRVHLAVPLAIVVALIVATIKGSMVARVFMHLREERRWIYGMVILMAAGFFVLLLIPVFTVHDMIGTPVHQQIAAPGRAGATGR
jgi:caa(3)-type oxidase subunit IV